MELTKAQAQEKGEELLKLMKDKRWELRVWENMGWHYAVRNGPIDVHPAHDGSYGCLVAESIDGDGGSMLWSTNFSHSDPNKVAAHEVEAAREVLDKITTAIEYAESVL